MKQGKFLKNSLIYGLCFVVTFLVVLMVAPAQSTTVDDSVQLKNLLSKQLNKNILGANSKNQNTYFGCSETKPYIGWINFSGEKKLMERLPDGASASGCFATEKEALEGGFKR